MLHQSRRELIATLALVGLFVHVNATIPTRDLCPVSCMESGIDQSEWTVLAEIDQLQACNRPMVLDFSLQHPVTTTQQIRVCNVWANDFDKYAAHDISALGGETQELSPELAWTAASSENDIAGRLVLQSVGHLQSYLASSHLSQNKTVLFGTVSNTTVGVYVGANLLNPSIAESLFDPFTNVLRLHGLENSKSALMQACENRTESQIFGIIAAATSDFATVHTAVRQWANGTCVDTSSYGESRQHNKTAIAATRAIVIPTDLQGNSTANYLLNVRGPRPPAHCRTVTVESGDDCGTVISRCGNGLKPADFHKYNPRETLCSTLRPGESLCCTEGKLPDNRPKPEKDGSCKAYQIQKGEYCSVIAARYGLTVEDLQKFNENTWGWNGCYDGFWENNWMCLSTGTPPFPRAIENAVCGPQKPGTKKPAGSTSRDWAKLNPCPLNACCNVWGQCGTTSDFCIDTNKGPPGTAQEGTYGCISNCGMEVVKSSPPTKFIKLGYFEGFNLGRNCLNMDPTQIDGSFTHVHFAFGMIDNDFNVYHENSQTEYMFEQFKKLTGPKRIISFGGWVFSAEAPNYHILRNAVKGPNRNRFADNLVKFVIDNNLDGLDIDWEYPSAPDLPGIPPGDKTEARDYLRLLTVLREKLPKDKSLSIAAPASFWYLKQFPIRDMAKQLDYIVYMTYDLHGQWDAGNKWSSPGCPSGNCLRSHVNQTETINALTMITKAGVPSNKVLVGVSSYGRSFQMADASCTSPNCLFTGDRLHSNARKGRCTDTAGYISNAEISEANGRTWIDQSNSNIMVDGDLWVSYMDDEMKKKRTQLYKRHNMGGTIDWAVDLAKFHNKPPKIETGGVFHELTWSQIKANIKTGKKVACDDEKRTGNWVSYECTSDHVVDPLDYTPQQKWTALECDAAWDDTIRIYTGCDRGEEGYFIRKVSAFLHMTENSDCDDLGHETSCAMQKCEVHHTANDKKSSHTGACAYLIWNSIASLHKMLKNYFYALQHAGGQLKDTKEQFIKTFAPKPDDGTEILNLFLTLIPVPIGIAGQRFIGGSLMKQAFFANDVSGNKKAGLETATSGLLSAGSSIAKDVLKEASEARAEMSFNAIFDDILGEWTRQTNLLVKRIFNGEDDNIKILTELFRGGKMIGGKGDGGSKWDGDGDYTASFKEEKANERAFYAAAIPAAWAANRPTPVVVDFGPSCEIDARKYFIVGPKKYNVGWRCPDGHSYILAGVGDGPIDDCVHNLPNGPICPPSAPKPLEVLKGIEDIQESTNKWGGVTVDDLIIGAVKTYTANGKRNNMDRTSGIPDFKDTTVLESYNRKQVDVQRAGHIRIPVCGPEEIVGNIRKGRHFHEKWLNYPCNP